MNFYSSEAGFLRSGSWKRHKTSTKRSDQELLYDIEQLTIQQLAKWAKVSPKSAYQWIGAGKIPVVKFGERTFRIPARAVIAHLKASGYDHLIPKQ